MKEGCLKLTGIARALREWKRRRFFLAALGFALALVVSAQPQASAHEGGRVLYVTATGYSALDPGNSPYTATGTLVRHGVIAVDPSVIPLGTHVFIPDYGEAIAEDIGWGVKGNMIDVAFDTHEEALMFGRQEIEIYIMD